MSASRVPLLIALLFAAVLGATGFLLVPPVYEGVETYAGNGDDPHMALVASGNDGTERDERLLYTHWFIGRGLNALYRRWPDTAWYGLYELTVLIAGWSICLFAWWSRLSERIGRVCLLVACITLAGHFWTHLQFTTVAGTAGLAGLSLLLTALLPAHCPTEKARESADEPGSPGFRIRLARTLGGGAFILLSAMIRWQVAGLLLLMTAPVLLALLCSPGCRGQRGRWLVIAIFGSAILMGVRYCDQQAYQETDWAAYKRYEHPHALLINNYRVGNRMLKAETLEELPASYQAALKEAGWSLNDAQAFLRWWIVDERVHSTESLETLKAALLDPYRPSFSALVFATRTIGREMIFNARRGTLLLLTLAVLLSLTDRRAIQGLGLAVWLGSVILAAVLGVFLKMEFYVLDVMSAAAFFAVLSLTALISPAAQPLARQIAMLLAVGAVLTGGMTLAASVNASRFSQEIRPSFHADIAQLEAASDRFYFIALPFPWHRHSPLDSMRRWRDIHFVYLDGFQRSPRYHRILRENDIKNPTLALVEDPRVRLIAGPKHLLVLEHFIAEHVQKEVTLEVERKLDWFTIYRVVPGKRTAPPPATRDEEAQEATADRNEVAP